MASTDEVRTDGTDGTANPEGSNSGDGQQSSIAGTDTSKQLKELQKQVDLLTRSLQSEKDKAVAKTNQRIDKLEGSIKDVLKAAAQRGQNVQDILGEIEAKEEAESRQALLEMAEAFRSGRFPVADARGNAQGAGVDVTNVLRELELDDSDVRVQEFRSRRFSSEAEAYREGAKLIKSITSKQPSDADLPSQVAQRTSGPDKNSALMQEYESRKQGLRGQALINLKMEMRKKGLSNIY